MWKDKDYNIIILYFDNKGSFCKHNKCLKSESYDNIEYWSRTTDGMCHVIDMRLSIENLKKDMVTDKK